MNLGHVGRIVDRLEASKGAGMNHSTREVRSRRSNLAVPGSSTKMLEKAKGLPADQVFMTSRMRSS
jgi:hypothetical protein